MVFTSCVNSNDMFKPLEKITINGTIADANNNLLDSVKITLYRSYFGDLWCGTTYSKSGTFEIKFEPEAFTVYHLDFEKKGHIPQEYHIDATKKVQKCNIIMERAVE
jgi:hypothetical protein